MMKALILAAGRGQRMRPLTDTVPKPLLTAGGRRLIEWQIEGLARAGACEIVINTAHMPDAFEQALGDGAQWGVSIRYSREGSTASDSLETLGGVVKALPMIDEERFVVVSGDIVTDFDYSTLAARAAQMAADGSLAHLVLVDNPPFHAGGDMALVDGRIVPGGSPRLTYANIAVFSARLFADVQPGRARLFPWLYRFADNGLVSGEHFHGRWYNVGTPAELARLDGELTLSPLAALERRSE